MLLKNVRPEGLEWLGAMDENTVPETPLDQYLIEREFKYISSEWQCVPKCKYKEGMDMIMDSIMTPIPFTSLQFDSSHSFFGKVRTNGFAIHVVDSKPILYEYEDFKTPDNIMYNCSMNGDAIIAAYAISEFESKDRKMKNIWRFEDPSDIESRLEKIPLQRNRLANDMSRYR